MKTTTINVCDLCKFSAMQQEIISLKVDNEEVKKNYEKLKKENEDLEEKFKVLNQNYDEDCEDLKEQSRVLKESNNHSMNLAQRAIDRLRRFERTESSVKRKQQSFNEFGAKSN